MICGLPNLGADQKELGLWGRELEIPDRSPGLSKSDLNTKTNFVIELGYRKL